MITALAAIALVRAGFDAGRVYQWVRASKKLMDAHESSRKS